MSRKRKIGLTFIFLLIAYMGYQFTIIATPYLIQIAVKIKSGKPLNEPVFSEVVTDKERRVVMPNPDFLYVVMGYDLKDHPLHIRAQMPDSTYYSIAFYSASTKNYYVQNDRQTPDKKVDIILAKEGETIRGDHPASKIVYSPGRFGSMLVRILICDSTQIPYLQKIQHSLTAMPLSDQ